MSKCSAYATVGAQSPLAAFTIERREPGASDVRIDIQYCGICHSDLHQARGEWGNSSFPMVPGHEIVGRISEIGASVGKFEVGDLAAVGCFVDSCRECEWCRRGLEQFCSAGVSYTYNSTEQDRRTPTQGGYSKQIVVDERYVLRLPPGLDPAAAAPLLCAGITTYSPLRQWKCKAGDRVAVVGLGGLGHMAVKLAVSMGAQVTVLSTSSSKEPDARRLGADGFSLTKDAGALPGLERTFDLIVDTVSARHDYNAYLQTLRPFGAMVVVGIPPEPTPVAALSLIGGNRSLAGSSIGGIAETQEMLDYCATHGIVSDIELIPIQLVNEAYERLLRGDVRYRFVIDVASLDRN